MAGWNGLLLDFPSIVGGDCAAGSDNSHRSNSTTDDRAESASAARAACLGHYDLWHGLDCQARRQEKGGVCCRREHRGEGALDRLGRRTRRRHYGHREEHRRGRHFECHVALGHLGPLCEGRDDRAPHGGRVVVHSARRRQRHHSYKGSHTRRLGGVRRQR